MQLVRWNWGIWKRGVWILNILFFYNIWRLEHNKFLHNFYQVEGVWEDNSLPFALWGLVVVAWKGVRWKLFSKLEKYQEKGDRVRSRRTFTFPKRHYTWSANGPWKNVSSEIHHHHPGWPSWVEIYFRIWRERGKGIPVTWVSDVIRFYLLRWSRTMLS